MARLSIGPLAPFLADNFGLSNTQVGGLASATAVVYTPMLLAAGWLVDRIGVRRILVLGTLIMGLSVSCIFFARSYFALLGLLALSGLGCGCIFPAAVRGLIAWFPLRERATAVGFNSTAVNVSGIAGGAFLPSVAVAAGWHVGFLIAGGLGLVACALCLALYRDPPSATAPGGRDVARVVSGAAKYRLLLVSRDIWLLSAAGVCLGFVEFSAIAHLTLYLKQVWLFTPIAAGALLAVCEAGGGVGKPVNGFLSDRPFAGRRRPALMICSVVTIGMCVPLALSNSSAGWWIYPALAIFGFVAIGWGGLYGTLAGEIGGHELAGSAIGFTGACANVGMLVGPPVFGLLVDKSGSYRPAWLLLAGFAALAALCTALLHEPQRTPVQEEAACTIPSDPAPARRPS